MNYEYPVFLITGHGRSGTKYMSLLFQHFGYQVGHETMCKNGISANQLAVEGVHALNSMCRYGRSIYRMWVGKEHLADIDYIVHVVRDPWKVAASNMRVTPTFKRTAQAVLDIKAQTAVEQTLKSIVIWNQKAAELKPDITVKVEEAVEEIPAWLSDVGLNVLRVGEPPSITTNRKTSSAPEPLTQDELAKVHPSTLSGFKRHCDLYGY